MTVVFLHPRKSHALNGRSDWTPGILTLVLSQVQELITNFLPSHFPVTFASKASSNPLDIPDPAVTWQAIFEFFVKLVS